MPTVFTKKAPKIVGNLMRDFALQDFQAAGILGNIGHECGGFLLMQEIKPKAGRGGLGWCQWTGPRRVTFETYCKKNNVDTSSDEGNYGYLVQELRTTEASAITAVKKTNTLADAVEAFETHFERAGVPAIPSRVKWAALAFEAYQASRIPAVKPVAPTPAPTPASTPAAPPQTIWQRIRSLFNKA